MAKVAWKIDFNSGRGSASRRLGCVLQSSMWAPSTEPALCPGAFGARTNAALVMTEGQKLARPCPAQHCCEIGSELRGRGTSALCFENLTPRPHELDFVQPGIQTEFLELLSSCARAFHQHCSASPGAVMFGSDSAYA